MRYNVTILQAICAVAASVVLTQVAWALPFNQDMVGSQPVTGRIMRPKEPNSVPFGSVTTRLASRQEAEKLENPLKGDALSTANGEKLFGAHCTTCHGLWIKGESGATTWQTSSLPVGMPSMNLAMQIYKDRTDGYIFGAIHYGSYSTLMPAYGWKFSIEEHWDMVNYIRKMQSEIK
jgi:hypothetical protein